VPISSVDHSPCLVCRQKYFLFVQMTAGPAGCARNIFWNCHHHILMILIATHSIYYSKSVKVLNNCSCTAYASGAGDVVSGMKIW
jgi:hypothetical protein